MPLHPIGRMTGLALTGLALITISACGDSPQGATPEASAPEARATPEAGPWDKFGLPAPGTEGTDTTTSIASINFINEGKLDALKPADRKVILESMETVFEKAYWRLEEFPERRQQVGQFDEYFSPDAASDFDDQVREDGSASIGIFTGPRAGWFYQYSVDSIDVEVLEAFIPEDKAFGPYASFRVSSRATWISLPWTETTPKKLRGKPLSQEMTTKVTVDFSNVDDDEFAELVRWESQEFEVEDTPVKKSA